MMTNSTPTIHTASAHDIVQPSRLRRHIAILTLIAYIGQPIAATAEIIADQAAAANNRPVVDATANGLPLVQIATPGAAGVSHNQYTQFNVDPAGLILNNSQSTVLTRQAGYVSANPNLGNSPARIILNEITSTHRSQLNGYTEVAGQQAEVIIANPNGITCNGCGFINTSRGVLTTGMPVMGASGSLDAFRVTGGDIQIGTGGMNGSNLNQLDLISRSVKVNGELWASNLNIITGANLADYNTLGVQVIQGAGIKPTVGIDVALLGGMYANKITLIGTEAGVGVNSLGNLSAQAGDFTLDNQGQITLGGSTTASGNLTIAGNTSITNSGTLYSQQTARLTSTGSITNSGLLSAQGNLTLNAANLNSTGILGAGIDINGNATQNGNLNIATQNQTVASGTNISGGNMSISAADINLANSNTNARSGINFDATSGNIDLSGAQTQSVVGDIVLNASGSVTNNQGSLYGVAITSTSAGFSNTSGSVYASGNLNINSSTSLNNSGQLLAQRNLTLNASSLNSSGTLGSGIDVNGNATQNGSILITTQNQAVATGANMAGGNMSITAADINLASSNTNAWNGINLNATAGNIDLTSAQTQSVVGDIVLNATGTVNNTSGLLFGAQVSSNAASFSNANGALGAYGNISMTANSIDNTNGQIGNALNGAGNITLTATGNLTNTGGQIGSDQDLIISANTIAGNGQVIAGRDTGISLQGNYTNAAGNEFKANRNLTFGTTGNFINQTTFESVGMLSVNAANITNQSGALINANLNMLTTAGNIANAGRIEGNTVETHSNNFNNTATVMGGTLNLYANNLTNLNASAFIGATQAANLVIANALNNQDGATLYSLGDINIGSSLALNANGYLTGNAASVTNQSATIEATGNLRISANTITNKRTVVGIEWGSATTGVYVSGTASYNGVGGTPNYTPTFQDQRFTAVTTATSQMLANGNMWFSGSTLTNDYSTIVAGGGIFGQQASFNNIGSPLISQEIQSGIQVNYNWGITGTVGCNVFQSCYTYGWVYAPLPYYRVITTPIPNGLIPTVTYLQNTQPAGTPHTVNTQSVVDGVMNSGAAALTLGSSQVSVTTGHSSNTINVPTSGLYTLRTQPNQTYLVVTDPRFTSYQNFVSSDYMLSRLSLDPQQIQKRLGDGFYEQKLVTDQITAQTGRRYLGDYADAQSQFIALLDAGVTAAKDLQLVPGIALTTKQIDALTRDMVWMEEREVTLPNGSTERVLAPQVYLTRVTQANLTPGGALIAANDISMTSGDSITNSGAIQGRDSNILQAKNITNRGGVIGSQGFTLLKADNDIFNLSGKINGKTVGLNAGRDIVSERTSRNVTRTVNMGQQGDTGFGLFRKTPIMGVVNSTELGLESIISATDSLNINAGRDISLVAASIASGGDTTLNAGRDLTFGVLTNTESASTSLYSASRTNITQLTSGIQTGGSLNLLSGSNMRLTSATLDIGKDATLIAGGNLTLDASKNSTRSGFDTGVAQQRKYDETVIGTTLNAGGNVTLIATRPDPLAPNGGEGGGEGVIKTGNITLQSANISSQKGKLAVLADNNITIGTTEEQHEFFQQMRTESKGRFSSKTTTSRTSSNETLAIGSGLSADSINIQAGNKQGNINVIGSSIAGTNDVILEAANDINILAATSSYSQSKYSHTATSGLLFNGGPSITLGKREQTNKFDASDTTQSQNRSLVGSTNGNLSLKAGGNALISGSDIIAANNIDLSAQNVTINSGLDKNTTTQSQDNKQSGLTVAVTSNVTDAVQTVQQMKQASKQSKDKRIKALAATSAALNVANVVSSGPNIGVSATLGSSQSHSESTQQTTLSSGSTLNAGGNINIRAAHFNSLSPKRGEGWGEGVNTTEGNITIQGSDIQAGNNVTLDAENQINLLAAQNTASQTSHNTSSSSGAGVGATFGSSGTAIGFTTNASRGRGNADGSDLAHINTQINAGNTLTLKSGGDTNLKGAVANGNQIVADIGGDLNIQSLQDTSTYNSKQTNAGGSVTVGAGVSGSVNYGNSNANSGYASVNQQSGLNAGNGGFQIAVRGNTDLKGAVIASSEQAIQDNKNTFVTATLTTSDIANHAEASAEAGGVSLSSDMVTQSKYGVTKGIVANTMNNAGESGSSVGQTRSAVSAGMVVITDEAKQKERTGKSTQETVATLNRDTATTHTSAQKQDVGAMQQTVEAEQAIKQEAVKIVTTFTDETYRSRFKQDPKAIKVQCPAGANCDADPSLLQRSVATADDIKNADPGSILAVNGILNDEKRAAELGYQNIEPSTNPETGKKEKPTTFYVMHIAPANNTISELLGVAYEKIVTSADYGLANFLGYTNGMETYAELLRSRGQEATTSLAHSRGTLVQKGGFTILVNRPDQNGNLYTNPNLTVRGVGGAADAGIYTEAAAKVQGPQGDKGNITYNYFSNDPVSTSTISGGNPGVWTLKDLWQVFDTSNSMHSCYGTGAKGCTQVEIPVSGGPQGTPEGNAKLIQYKGGKRFDNNPIGRDPQGGSK